MSIIEFFSQPVWHRIGLTLVHFLWQGLIMAVLVGVCVRILKVREGNNRYTVYLLAFLAMMLCPIVTFIAIDVPGETISTVLPQGAGLTKPVYIASDTTSPVADELSKANISSASTPKRFTNIDSVSLRQRASDYLRLFLPWLLVAWMVGILILSVRLMMGFIGVYRWRRHLEPLPEGLAQRIGSLTEKLGMKGFSEIFISPSVIQAMAAGYLRPMVLLPAAMVMHMQPEMLEAVIAHELAHIRRYDLWVNLIQRIAETLLFYHPAVWWLSGRLRTERELCCDELAVEATKQRLTYAATLESVHRATLTVKQPVLAAGLGQDCKPTLSRVRHILDLAPAQHNCPFWLAGVVAVLLLAGLTIPTTLALTSEKSGKTGPQVANEMAAEAQVRQESAEKLRRLGAIMVRYIADHDGKLPGDKPNLAPYIGSEENVEQLARFVIDNVEGIGDGEGKAVGPNPEKFPIAYDRSILQQRQGTNVLFADGHVEFLALAKLKGLGIKPEISHLKVVDVDFEPIRQGKNVVHVKVQNISDENQVLRMQIYTRSPDYGEKGIGWGTSFFETVKAGETKSTRFVFKIQGPVTDSTYIRLDFYNLGPAEGFDVQKWRQKAEKTKWFKRATYTSGELDKYDPQSIVRARASREKAETVTAKLKQIQEYMRNKKYEQVWQSFSKDYRDAEYQLRVDAFERFKKAMEPKHPLDSAFVWEKGDFLKLRPEKVFEQDGVLTVEAFCDSHIWTVDFIQEDGQWKIDWISGYTPRVLSTQKWEERLLPKLEKRTTRHFDIYYFRDSTAEKEIEQIVADKERGFSEICQFLDITSRVRIRLILFEDGQRKHWETGHQGNGWAFGNTIVEVYNEKTKLDPYHETVHILMRPFGNPPALFNEGFAVYMSERLGANSLRYLGGGESEIYERVKELKAKNELWELRELLGFTEIGSMKTRPPVAYPQAASFVKFLVEKYGKERFLDIYKTLENGRDNEQNIERLERICNRSFPQLEGEWTTVLSE
jgi:prepilin-type processing-associated H-X9-DG protein